jgi:hypothetical protein
MVMLLMVFAELETVLLARMIAIVAASTMNATIITISVAVWPLRAFSITGFTLAGNKNRGLQGSYLPGA